MTDHHALYWENGVFTAPVAGYYHVASEIIRYEPTDEYEAVENYDRGWWQFWKPRYIWRQKYRRIEEMSGRQVKFLQKDEEAFGPGYKL